jgi:predicted Zn-dependent protease
MQRGMLFLLAGLLLFSGCGINPVTGEREFALISETQEIAIGEENYLASRQMQGGDYAVDSGLTAYVNQVGQGLARVADRDLPYEFVVVNNSVPNAWALPGGKIGVNRGLLLELQNEAELAAVLAHEIVHAAARHGAKGLERGFLLQSAVVTAGIATQGGDYSELLVGGANIAAALIQTKYGRDAELQADYYGMLYMKRAGYDPAAAIGLQETFVRLSQAQQENWLAGLFASHPPSAERVAANRRTASQLGTGGIVGRERYQERIAYLAATEDAYDYAEQGRAALEKDKYQQALQLGTKAVAMVPREGQFHALLGDVFFENNDYRQALSHYDRAVAQPGEFYYFYLQRGLTRERLEARPGASADLERSIKLLPMAIAYNALGNLSLAASNVDQAKEYFRAAADSSSEIGHQSLLALVRLDLPDNPDKYLSLRTGLQGPGILVVEVRNTTALPVTGVLLRISFPDAQVRIAQTTGQISNVIPPGGVVQLKVPISPVTGQEMTGQVRAQVVSAQVADR